MKFIGAVCIVVAGFFLGYTRRAAQVKSERTVWALSQLFGELADSIEYRARALGEVLDLLCAAEKYAALDFLPACCRLRDAGETLHDALCKSFLHSACAASLSGGEHGEALEVLRALGCETDVLAVNRLRAAGERFAGFARARRDANSRRAGYYETIYTLAGAAAAIALL